MGKVFYHVVTERPVKINQIISYDENNHSGVYERVYSLKDEVKDIYANPSKYQNLTHYQKVALRELALEEVRKKYYPMYPSRLESLYVSKTLKEAIEWYKYFKSLGRQTFQIIKVETNGTSFTSDACNCFDGTLNKENNLFLAKIYWEGKDNKLGKKPVYETIISGKIKVIEIINEKEYDL